MKGELTKDEIREMIRREPETREAGLSDERIEEIAADMYSRQEEIVREEVYAFVAREMIRIVNNGEAEYDPETDRYRIIKPGQ